jgi:hypothetical protein
LRDREKVSQWARKVMDSLDSYKITGTPDL